MYAERPDSRQMNVFMCAIAIITFRASSNGSTAAAAGMAAQIKER